MDLWWSFLGLVGGQLRWPMSYVHFGDISGHLGAYRCHVRAVSAAKFGQGRPEIAQDRPKMAQDRPKVTEDRPRSPVTQVIPTPRV